MSCSIDYIMYKKGIKQLNQFCLLGENIGHKMCETLLHEALLLKLISWPSF